MKKIKSLIMLCILALTLQNCSSVKVMDSWKSDEISNLKTNNFLVIARTQNKQARVAFENETVAQMTEKGYKATASFTKFPQLNPDETMTEERQQKIKAMLEDQGYDGVVLTIVKDYQEQTRVETDGGYYAGGNYYGYYPRYYGGFYGYYNHPMSFRTTGTYVPATTTEYTAKVYIVETTIYNLKATDENQLVAIVTSQIDNPDNAKITAKDYVKKVAGSLK